MKKNNVWLLAVAALSLAACGGQDAGPAAGPTITTRPTEGQLSGEVFVVTRGGQNIKLGLVTVTAIPEASINEFLNNRRSDVGQIRKEKEQLIQAKTADVEAVSQTRANAEKKADAEYWECMGTEATRPECEARKRQSLAQWDRKLAEMRAEISKARNDIELLESSEMFLIGFPAGIASAKTNADGRFTMALPTSGRFALAASASRAVLDQTEKYHWLVWVSLGGQETAHIMLANDNLITSGSPESVITLTR